MFCVLDYQLLSATMGCAQTAHAPIIFVTYYIFIKGRYLLGNNIYIEYTSQLELCPPPSYTPPSPDTWLLKYLQY